MTEQATQAQPLQFMLADTDPIFRAGLKACLEAIPDIQVVAEADNPAQVLQLFAAQPDASFDPQSLDLLIVDVSRVADTEANTLLCQQLKGRYPTLALFVLSATVDPDQLTKLWQVGVEGFCPKGSVDTATLVQQFQRASQGQRVWDAAYKAQLQTTQSIATPVTTQEVTAFTLLRQVFMQTGLKQIEQTLERLQAQQQGVALTQWQRAVNDGRKRELQTVQWLVARYLERQSDSPEAAPPAEVEEPAFSWANVDPWDTDEVAVPSRITEISEDSALAAQPDITPVLMDALLAKLPTSLANRTPDPLEIDILKAQKRQELFLIVLKRFEAVVEELRFSQVTRSQLAAKRATLLQDLWLASTADFFGKYLTLPLSASGQGLEEIEMVSVLQQDQAIVEAEILHKIPLVTELLEHLLFQAPLRVDNTLSAVGSPEATLQAEALLSNLVVSVANAVIQPLLNRFATHEVVKQSFYDRTLISTRDIERFRNALSNHYRIRRLFKEPKNIFESQFGLIVFSEAGLQKIAVYASRDQELKTLQGIRFFVTLALEARDAIAPPLQTTFTFLGRGVVYILTQVIGRGLGLIGRGILQGVGGTWQDIFVSRKSHQEK